SLLTEDERDWLNTYHREVLDKITPMVNEDILTWLKEAVKSV
ncbi:MAG: M24 family metallopeptidase C-terminal domain-containing protein, partial [Candidatus Marinimicrobia bacterium]|nr:M24 family metallopeptidase C-terminal domain-containing protein [Candidatus Neomarinimicrobiota bacterium]